MKGKGSRGICYTFVSGIHKELITLKSFLTAFLILLSFCEANSASIIRGIAPNSGAPGRTITVNVVVENTARIDASAISFGSGIVVRSIKKQSLQTRHERRMLFLQLEVNVNASAAIGARNVQVGDSAPGQQSTFYVQARPALRFQNFRQTDSDLIPFQLLPANLDSDEFQELVSVNLSPFTEGNVSVFHPFENRIQTFYATAQGTVVSAREAALADRDGNGVLDLSVLNWVQFDVLGGVLVQARNRGDGTFEVVSDRQSKIADLYITSGDFNRDGYDDLALVGYTGEVFVLPGGGKQSLRFHTTPRAFPGEIQGMNAEDINGDGYDDLVLAIDNEASGNKEFAIVLARKDGTFLPARRIALPFAEEGPWAFAISDLNRDGTIEFIFTTSRYQELVIARFSDGNFEYSPTINVECNAIAVRDLDGDGDSDIACAGADIDQVTLFRTTGGSSLLPRVTLPAPRYPVSIAIGDWDADGKADLATGYGKTYFPHLPNERNGLTFLLQE